MEKTGIEISDQDIFRMMEELNLKNSKRLDFKEFCTVLDGKIYIATNAYDILPPELQEKKMKK